MCAGSEADVSDRPSFEVEWPPVARRLQSALRRRRVPHPLAEDLIQETGLRLFQIWERVDPGRDPWPLALTIALNILRDHIRADNRRQEVVVIDDPVEDDTEAAALARLELARVQEALVQLTSAQRSALLAEVGAATMPRESSPAMKMLRMRARKRLRALMDGASAAVGALGSVVQRALRAGSASSLGEQLAPGASIAAGVLWAGTLGGLGVVAGGDASLGPGFDPESARPARPHHERVSSATAAASQTRSSTPARGSRADASLPGRADKGLAPNPWPAEGLVERHDGGKGPEKRPSARRPPTGVRVHNPRVQVEDDGYDVRGRLSGSAAGHTVQAVVKATSTASENRSAGGCAGVDAPEVLCTRPKGGLRAKVDDNETVDVSFENGISTGSS